MQLTLWTYEGPPHVGAMRIATAMRDVHYVLHAPQGDTYADLLFTMIERRAERPPVTYTTFQARDLGGDTATLLKNAVREAYERFRPQVMLVGASCTAELLQDDPGGLAKALDSPNSGHSARASRLPEERELGRSGDVLSTRAHARRSVPAADARCLGAKRSELQRAGSDRAGLPSPRRRDRGQGTSRRCRCGRERGRAARRSAGRHRPSPRGGLQRRALPRDRHAGRKVARAQLRPAVDKERSPGRDGDRGFPRRGVSRLRSSRPRRRRRHRMRGCPGIRARSIRPISPASASSSSAMPPTPSRPRVSRRDEIGFTVVGLGTYSREFAREVREAAKSYGVEALISDDYLEVERAIAAGCSPSWCSARRWSATSPSGWAFPAR